MELKEDLDITHLPDDNNFTEFTSLEVETKNTTNENDSPFLYDIDEKPPLLVTMSIAVQHAILSLPFCLTASTIAGDTACVPFGHPARAALFSGTILMSGLATIMQSAFGVRMAILQGPSVAFFIPLQVISMDSQWKCPNGSLTFEGDGSNSGSNDTSGKDYEDGMYLRLQTISGSLMLASFLEIILGASGILRIVMRYVSPITVAVTITIIPIPVTGFVVDYSSPSFSLALGTAGLILLFSLYMTNLRIPIPSCGKGRWKKPRTYFPLFQVLPVLVAMCITWCIAGILTKCDVFTNDKTSIQYYARTDAKAAVIENTPWFMLVYPGKFGVPKFNLAFTVGFLLAGTASMFESIGDYYSAQKVCHLTSLPGHAAARGILAEGLASFLAGFIGIGHATTSYSTNIGILAVTRAVSRRIMYAVGIMYIALSFAGKVGAGAITIPHPIIGGVTLVLLGLVISIGLSNLANIDMTSSRNMFVFGVPFMTGIVIPATLEQRPEIIATGSDDVDSMIRMILQNSMFLGGIMACILDNTVPGDYESRGIKKRQVENMEDASMANGLYNKNKRNTDEIFSWTGYPKIVKRLPFLRYVPFLPQSQTFRVFKTRESLSNNNFVQ